MEQKDLLEPEYVEREIEYYKNLKVWPEFDIYNQHIDGLIPTTRVESWRELHNVVGKYIQDNGEQDYVFRGQQNYKWLLESTLERLLKDNVTAELANKQLKRFRLSIRGRVPDNTIIKEDPEELWAIGQHHGLSTPLLDWSLSPYVSLFFAFMQEDPETWVDDEGKHDNYSRVIYVINKSFIADLVEDNENPHDKKYPKIVEPSKDDHGRLVNQAGLFTFAPYGESLETSLMNALRDSKIDINDIDELSKYICRIHIPNSPEIRLDCLRHLRKMNIHHASLFPDLIGASGYCNELLVEQSLRLKLKEKEIKKVVIPIKDKYAQVITDSVKPFDESNKAQEIVNVLQSCDVVAKNLNSNQLKTLSHIIISFTETSAGIDWQVRDSQVSRIKNIIRRRLQKMLFPDDLIKNATDIIVDTAINITSDED